MKTIIHHRKNLTSSGKKGKVTMKAAIMNGIDVSKHNGAIDWIKVKQDGVDFAILRLGLGKYPSQKDTYFDVNYKGCKANGIHVGAYWYSYAKTPDEAVQEANACITCLTNTQLDMPVYFDFEETAGLALGKEKISAIIRAFLDTVEKAGYYVGLYMSRSPLMNLVDKDIRQKYTIWVAEWNSSTCYPDPYDMWQRSCNGDVKGIKGNVDLDICYKDFPTIIKQKGLNNYGTSGTGSTDNGTNVNPVSGGVKPPADDGTVGCIIKIGNKTYVGVLREQPPD